MSLSAIRLSRPSHQTSKQLKEAAMVNLSHCRINCLIIVPNNNT